MPTLSSMNTSDLLSVAAKSWPYFEIGQNRSLTRELFPILSENATYHSVGTIEATVFEKS